MNDTIAAYSGGTLPAAIGIVRFSGPLAFDILDRVFTPKSGKTISNCISGKLYYGMLSDIDGKTFDLCTVAIHRAPRSYTGEDMAEIFCHGSAAIVASALERAYTLGARPAKAGEFTMRAFLNGKLDLTEAEAVADLIHAPSAQAAKVAAGQIMGGVGTEFKAIRAKITALLAHFYAVCDYSDEDIDPFECQNAFDVLTQCARQLEHLRAGFERGRFIREGVPVAITGRPNTGKSSLFNALCGHDRAIVTEEPGTTRDVLDTVVTCGGGAIRLLDTAGIREAEGKAEQIGITKALETIANTQSTLCLSDCSQPANADDARVLSLALESPNCALIFSKLDLGGREGVERRLGELRQSGHEAALREVTADAIIASAVVQTDNLSVFAVSAKSGAGLPALVEWLSALAVLPTDGAVITSARQAALAESAADDLRAAAQSARLGMTADAFLSDAERALNTLGQITGESASADIASEIFARFCVGK